MIDLRQATNEDLVEIFRWHGSETLNRLTGSGGGEPGIKLARQFLHSLATAPPPDTLLLVAVEDQEQVGYIVISHINENHKRAQIHLTVSPEHRREGLGTRILSMAVQRAFDSGLYRVEFNPLQGNHAAKELAHSLGFILEGVTVSSFWMLGEGPKNQYLFRLTQREWDAKNGRGKIPSPRRRVRKAS